MQKDNEISKDYLPGFPNIVLFQHKKMFRVNTDTSLLGHYIRVKEGDKVLDIGTNNGALLLYARNYKPSLLMGIDINKKAIEIAKVNLSANNIKNYILEAIDLKEFNSDLKFDVIVSNPPYFNTKNESLKNSNVDLKMARHEEYLSLDILFNKVYHNLNEDGHFYLVHPYFRFNEVKEKLNYNKLFIDEYCVVRDENKNTNHVILYNISKCNKGITKQGDTIVVKR